MIKATITLLLLGLLVSYVFLVEPNWLEIKHISLELNVKETIKIAHITDLHTRGLNYLEKKIVAEIEKESPELIVITGDTVTPRGTVEGYREVLSKLKAPLGVWAIRGNWENWLPTDDESKFYKSLGIHFLLNEGREVLKDLWIVGLDDGPTGTADLDQAFNNIPDRATRIVLIHSPSDSETVAQRSELILAGHSHGGQVRIPFIGPLWLPNGVGKYVSGMFTVGKAKLYVSRGIGTSILPIRLLCRPELTFLTISPNHL